MNQTLEARMFDTRNDLAPGTRGAIVERLSAVALGGVARGTIEEIAGQSTLPAYPLIVDEWRTHVRAMQAALATFGRGARQGVDRAAAVNDAGTADLLTDISRGIDTLLWMVEAHAQETPHASQGGSR